MQKYIGIAYEQMNCLEFVQYILSEEFGKSLVLPASCLHEEITEFMYANRSGLAIEVTGDIESGDVVLFKPGASVMHVGVIINEPLEPYVLHSRLGVGSCYNPLRIVARQMKVSGFYRVS